MPQVTRVHCNAARKLNDEAGLSLSAYSLIAEYSLGQGTYSSDGKVLHAKIQPKIVQNGTSLASGIRPKAMRAWIFPKVERC